ncbi:MAG: thiamine-phosphate synthase family protein [Bacillota bacterium]
MRQAGDDILITKGAAIEATALLANELAGTLAQKGVPADLIKRARHRLREVSVVQEAQLAVAVGGVHAMHDATEGGLERGLYEIARASGVGLRVERAKVLLPDDIRAVCECFALNPYQVISEGTLVLTCAPEKTEELLATFHAAGIDAAVIGAVMPAGQGMHWVEEDGQETVLAPPAVDRFWEVFFAALGPQEELCRELAQAVKTLQEAGIAALIPEIGANLAYGPENAQGTEEIAAIPGRLLRLRDEVVVLGEPELGCSTYMGGTLLAVQQHFPARCVINLRHNEKVRDACRELGFHMVSMPAPADFRQSDADFFRDLHATLAACRELPDVIEIPDRINLERLILVLGQTLPALVEKVVSLAERVP